MATITIFTIPTFLCTLRSRSLLPDPLGHVCVIHSSTLPSKLSFSPLFTVIDINTAIARVPQEVKHPRNFAHFGDGARILPEVTSLTYGTKDNGWLSQDPSTHGLVSRTPPYIVSDEAMRIGDCWEFEGSRGTLGILLSEPTRIASIHLDNISPNLVSWTSATKTPRTIHLWGLVGGDTVLPPGTRARHAVQFSAKSTFNPKSRLKASDNFALLLEVDYNPRAGPTSQLFSLPPTHWSVDVIFHAVVLEILDNWGGDTTCLYHFSIHQE